MSLGGKTRIFDQKCLRIQKPCNSFRELFETLRNQVIFDLEFFELFSVKVHLVYEQTKLLRVASFDPQKAVDMSFSLRKRNN